MAHFRPKRSFSNLLLSNSFGSSRSFTHFLVRLVWPRRVAAFFISVQLAVLAILVRQAHVAITVQETLGPHVQPRATLRDRPYPNGAGIAKARELGWIV